MMQLTSSTCGGGLVERLCIYSISNNVMNINCGKSDAYLVKNNYIETYIFDCSN